MDFIFAQNKASQDFIFLKRLRADE